MRPKKIVITELGAVEKLVEQVNRDGLQATAEAYDTSAATLSRWLKKAGFSVRNVWAITPAAKEVLANA